MAFSVSRDAGAFEWAGSNLRAVFCQPSRLLDPCMWRLLYDVVRFNVCARKLLGGPKRGSLGGEEISIGDYLCREGYSESFRDNYLIVSNSLTTVTRCCGVFGAHNALIYSQPMTAAIWSTPPDKCSLDFPARTLVRSVSLVFINIGQLIFSS